MQNPPWEILFDPKDQPWVDDLVDQLRQQGILPIALRRFGEEFTERHTILMVPLEIPVEACQAHAMAAKARGTRTLPVVVHNQTMLEHGMVVGLPFPLGHLKAGDLRNPFEVNRLVDAILGRRGGPPLRATDAGSR